MTKDKFSNIGWEITKEDETGFFIKANGTDGYVVVIDKYTKQYLKTVCKVIVNDNIIHKHKFVCIANEDMFENYINGKYAGTTIIPLCPAFM